MNATCIKSATHRQADKLQSRHNTLQGVEDIFECEMCFYQSQAKDFTPVTASADFSALECPNCLNNDKESFREVTIAVQLAA